MTRLSNNEICDELNKVAERVKTLTDYQMSLFRPPYDDYDNHVITNARECGYFTIQWSVNSLDWKNYGADSIVDTILNHKDLKNGAIILLHNGAKYTATALPKVIEGLKAKGFEIVPISELIYKDNFHMDSKGRQIPDSNVSTDNSTPTESPVETGT